MADDAADRAPTRARTEDVDLQRERYQELLGEFRTVIPGVEVLLGFLLTVPFSSRFGDLDAVGRRLYLLGLVTAAGSVITLLLPTIYHRLTPHLVRTRRIRVSVRALLLGLGLAGVAIVATSLLVVRFVFDLPTGVAVAGVLGLAMVGLWVLLPLRDARRHGGETDA